MIIIWMLYASIVGVSVSLAAGALDRAARGVRIPMRFIWIAAIVVTAVMPLALFAGHRAASVVLASGVAMDPVTATSSGPAVEEQSGRVAAFVGRLNATARSLDVPAAIVWGFLTIVLLSRLVWATAAILRRRRNWQARDVAGVSLFVTPDLGPAVIALPRSEILIPEWVLSLGDAEIATVVRHEREHHAAGDARLLVAASLVRALVPWNPALWWQFRRLRLAVEMDCDARVLKVDSRVDRYGALLLAIAQHPRTAVYGAATLTESTSDLERRIEAMTTNPMRAPRLFGGALVTVATALVTIACSLPTPNAIASPDGTDSPTASSADVAQGDPIYTELQVTRPAQASPKNLAPTYPNQLRVANIEGQVLARFVVDAEGRAEMSTFMVLKADHDLFVHAVRQALPKMTFFPADLNGKKVRQTVDMPFVFALARDVGGGGRGRVEYVPPASAGQAASSHAAPPAIRKPPRLN